MMKLKKVLRYIILGMLVILAMIGIPIGTFLPRREMDVENETKTEVVEGMESDKT